MPLPSAITRLCVNERDPFKKNSLPLRIPIDPAAAASMSMNGRRMLGEGGRGAIAGISRLDMKRRRRTLRPQWRHWREKTLARSLASSIHPIT